jgi:protein-tyrosine phosphatase
VIDTHCHLLPFLDDGPRSEEEALLLARQLSAAGVVSVVCTTHFSRQFVTAWSDVVASADRLQERLADDGVPLMLVPAAEVSGTFAMTQPLDELARRAVGTRYVIVEVGSDAPSSFFDTIVERLAQDGLRPVFAHPERSRAVQRSETTLQAARDAGALVQVVAPSLLGRWGNDTAAAAWRLVEHGTADLVGSDAHGVLRRRFHLPKVARLLERVIGRAAVDELTALRPRQLLAGGG